MTIDQEKTRIESEQKHIIKSFLARREEQLGLCRDTQYPQWYQLETECIRLANKYRALEQDKKALSPEFEPLNTLC